jgi:lipooligosaccharide transport system ATP-binding protein
VDCDAAAHAWVAFALLPCPWFPGDGRAACAEDRCVVHRLKRERARHGPASEWPLFQVRHLRKRYGDNTVVDDLSFSIAPGECLGVIGPNGAGKTTTIRMCLGQTVPDSGEVTAFGLAMPKDALAIKAQLGVVTQFDTLDPDFTCAENLRVFGSYFGLRDAEVRARVPQLLEFAALTSKQGAKPGELSGGMRRR